MNIPITRRTLVKGTAWATPVVIASSMVPVYAASQLNSTCTYSGSFAQASSNGTTATLPITSGGTTYTVVITAVKSSGTGSTSASTTDTSSPRSYNMTVGNKAWNGNNTAVNGSQDYVYSQTNSGLIINQIGTPDSNPAATSGQVHPQQTVTFKILDSAGKVVPVTNLKITIGDISAWNGRSSAGSATSPSWREKYWDYVAFYTAPTSIVDGTAGKYGYSSSGSRYDLTGTGAGTVSSPWHRKDYGASSYIATSLGGYKDTFVFASSAGQMNMIYSNPTNYGWQGINIQCI